MNERKAGLLSIFELEHRIICPAHSFIHSFEDLKLVAKFCPVTDQLGILLIQGTDASAYLPNYALRSMLGLPHPDQCLLRDGEPRGGWVPPFPTFYCQWHRSARAAVTASAVARQRTAWFPDTWPAYGDAYRGDRYHRRLAARAP